MTPRLRELGVTMLSDALIREWHGDSATIQPHGAAPQTLAAETLVVAATNVPERSIGDELGAVTIGDAVAARTTGMAIYEGRKLGMSI